jgi:hypothetical protein
VVSDVVDRAGDDDSESTRLMSVADVLGAIDVVKSAVAPSAFAVADLLARKEAAAAERYEARKQLLQALTETPFKFGFFQAVRLLENAHPGLPRIGTSLRLRDDPIRFAQSPSLAFARATARRRSPCASSGCSGPTARCRCT